MEDKIMKATILTTGEYELMAFDALIRTGTTREQAAELVLKRWPMDARSVRFELRARGLDLSESDQAEFLAARYGQPVDPDEIAWPARIADALLEWALANGRGEPHDFPAEARSRLPRTVDQMFAMLRSDNQADRIIGGTTLATALGAGCKLAGEPVEDFEHIIAPQLSDLIGRAMEGDPEAVEQLEVLVTTDPAAAFLGTRANRARK